MSFHPGSAKAWRIALGVLALLSFAAAIPLTVLSYQLGDAVIAALIGIPCSAVGWVVARRQPVNPLGWLFLVTGVLMALGTDGGDYGYDVYRLGPTFRSRPRDWPWLSSGVPAWRCSGSRSCCSPTAGCPRGSGGGRSGSMA